MAANTFGMFLLGLILLVLVLFLFAWVVQVTWNNSITVISPSAGTLTYWQSLAFLILVTVLGTFFARGVPLMFNYQLKW
jgi:hypothetical protein